MNILITAGGTSERIDEVRRIANSGTGRLGALVAEGFLASGRECRVVYVCSEGAARPCVGDGAGERLTVVVADDVRSVKAAVERACAERAFDAIVHSMAISDYFVSAVSDVDLVAAGVEERVLGAGVAGSVSGHGMTDCGSAAAMTCSLRVREAVRGALLSPPVIKEKKISSDKGNLVVVLEKAPKVISLLRGLAPSAAIVGFKLLVDVSEEELVRVGFALLQKNGCDFVLANDMRTVRDGRHEGVLIARDGSFERAQGKEGIAELIVKRVLEGLSLRGA